MDNKHITRKNILFNNIIHQHHIGTPEIMTNNIDAYGLREFYLDLIDCNTLALDFKAELIMCYNDMKAEMSKDD